MPRIAPPSNQVITQREKTFLPHVLAVPLGTTVQFRNDDRIYHNVFSIAKPNDFDAGIRATGATYTRTFNSPGAVEILCNIHSTMNGYVFVVDSPLYTKAQASGAFSIRGVAPGRYELAAWHEAATNVTRKTIVVGSDGIRDLADHGRRRQTPQTLRSRQIRTQTAAPARVLRCSAATGPLSATPPIHTAASRGEGAGAAIEGIVVGRRRRGPLLAAVAVLALTVGAVVLLMRLDHSRAGERVAAEAQAAALRAADGVRGLLGSLEGQTQNATANPRLVAALDANVDQETLRDLLLTEPWWEPFRRSVDGFGLYERREHGAGDVAAARRASTRARWCATRARAHHASPVCCWRRDRYWRWRRARWR